jgi:preprotein translocase subunit SecD
VRSTSTVLLFLFVAALTTFAVIVVWPGSPDRYLPGEFWPSGKGITIGGWERQDMRLGLDLRGGSYLVLEADPPPGYAGDIGQALDVAKQVVERRVNAFGVSEAEVQKTSGNRLSVQVPGLSLADAQSLIGKTAALTFMSYSDQQQSTARPSR